MRARLALVLLASGLAAAQAPAFKLENNTLVLPAPLVFTGDALDEGASRAALEHVKRFLEEKSYVSLLRIEGHVGAGAEAQPQSRLRALAVARWLVSHGVACTRVLPVAFGASKPVSAVAAENTRMALIVAGLRGRLIGGLPGDGGGEVAGEACALEP